MILYDNLLAGTPFRGLIIQGFSGLCAYLGVPQDHWMADMSSLTFECHHDVTFRGEGDGDLRPEGWYWYGWDYQHLSDQTNFPADMLALMPPEFVKLIPKGKNWTVAEVEQDLVDSALHLLESLRDVENAANSIVKK
ncbi:hypothetical protein [Acidovorax sp.]|uniref:hypothetical protein n=1 Tax=Acidovorax sp. TaxID=1872122 RepID=UPI00391F8868